MALQIEIPLPLTFKTQVRLSVPEGEELHAMAYANNITAAELARYIIREYLNQVRGETAPQLPLELKATPKRVTRKGAKA